MRTQSTETSSGLAAIGLHDVSPATWPECELLLALVRSIQADVAVTLLVVPDFHRRAPIDASSGWRDVVDRAIESGAEIALHGLSHLDDGGRSPTLRAFFARRFLTAGEAEFASLGAAEARERIERGLEMLRALRLGRRGIRPARLADQRRGAIRARRLRFRYTTTLRTITALPSDTRFAVPCLGFSSRSALRRTLSLRWNGWQLGRLRGAPALRIALHPIDARYAETLDGWRRFLEAALHDRRAVTKSDSARRSRCRHGRR